MLYIILVVLIILISILIFIRFFNKIKHKIEYSKIPFVEYLKATELPVIPLYYKEEKLYFLVDTGSNYSYIGESTYNRLGGDKEFKLTGEYVDARGFTGDMEVSPEITMDLNYEGFVHSQKLFVSTYLTESLQRIINKKGKIKEVSGIVGSDFLSRYKYIIDYSKCTLIRTTNYKER